MPNDAAAPEKRSDRAWGFLMGWVGRITAIVGLCATLAGGATWFVSHRHQQRERSAQLALAETQSSQGDYQASVETYATLLKADSLDREALDRQLNTTMLWAENFSVLVPEGQSATEPAGRALDAMMSILESGLTRSRGSRAADVQAHLGWAHWLNQHIAEREFGSAAEQNLRAALATDPSNVYANAMLGNWMLQNNGDFAEAVEHLHSAVASGKVRGFVRRVQLGGLSSYEGPGARAELVRVANAMRLGGETLSPDEKHRVFDICCDLTVTESAELAESLAAVAPQDAWETWLWLENAGGEASPDSLQGLTHDFIQAKLLEISGQAPQALARYRTVQHKLRAYPNAALSDAVDAAVQRLSDPRYSGERK
jgi:tetratricopeptide (TPR) repeat protein